MLLRREQGAARQGSQAKALEPTIGFLFENFVDCVFSLTVIVTK
jgi:hypothetical protein